MKAVSMGDSFFIYLARGTPFELDYKIYKSTHTFVANDDFG